jgi:formylglycine-generating enzyme required for sulfatase activity
VHQNGKMCPKCVGVLAVLVVGVAAGGCELVAGVEDLTESPDGGADTSVVEASGDAASEGSTGKPDGGSPGDSSPDVTTTPEAGTVFPSCAGGGAASECTGGGSSVDGGGDGGTRSCCASPTVPGTAGLANFFRSYDGVSTGDTNKAYPAAVSSLRVDAYEITVGRFRAFVNAVVTSNWKPTAGSGIHTHLNGGKGLANAAAAGSFEPGWVSSFPSLPTVQATWDSNLACDPTYATWTSSAGTNEHLPVNCITWYEAYAFCIWDGGFLPSEAEWNYVAAGGTDQRVYPWSAPSAMSTTIDCSYANYTPSSGCVAGGTNAVGSESSKGDGKWGQSDLAGNVWEWTLDAYGSAYPTPCADCANLPSAPTLNVTRGGSFQAVAGAVIASYRGNSAPTTRDPTIGARCGRAP